MLDMIKEKKISPDVIKTFSEIIDKNIE